MTVVVMIPSTVCVFFIDLMFFFETDASCSVLYAVLFCEIGKRLYIYHRPARFRIMFMYKYTTQYKYVVGVTS